MNLDKALDDIIKINKQSGRGGAAAGRRGRGGRFRGGRQGGLGSRGGGRAGALLRPRRPSAYQIAKSFLARRSDDGWQRDMYEDAVGSSLGIDTSTKLYVSNLDYRVSNEDVKELFFEMGELKHYGIHYDRSGRSIGTADVVFLRRSDAIAAMKRYNDVQLDGKPMKIELVGPTVLPATATGAYSGASMGRGRFRASVRGAGARSRGFGSRRSRGRGGRGRGRRSIEDRKAPTVEDLDADLEKYHKNAMQTS